MCLHQLKSYSRKHDGSNHSRQQNRAALNIAKGQCDVLNIFNARLSLRRNNQSNLFLHLLETLLTKRTTGQLNHATDVDKLVKGVPADAVGGGDVEDIGLTVDILSAGRQVHSLLQDIRHADNISFSSKKPK